MRKQEGNPTPKPATHHWHSLRIRKEIWVTSDHGIKGRDIDYLTLSDSHRLHWNPRIQRQKKLLWLQLSPPADAPSHGAMEELRDPLGGCSHVPLPIVPIYKGQTTSNDNIIQNQDLLQIRCQAALSSWHFWDATHRHVLSLNLWLHWLRLLSNLECQRCSNWNRFQGQALQEHVASNLRLAYSQQLSAATTGCRRDWWPPPSARNCTMSRWPFRAATNKRYTHDICMIFGCTTVCEKPHNVHVPILRCNRQGCYTISSCKPQGRFAIDVCLIFGCTTFCQKPHNIEIAIFSCKQQRRCAIVACLIFGCSPRSMPGWGKRIHRIWAWQCRPWAKKRPWAWGKTCTLQQLRKNIKMLKNETKIQARTKELIPVSNLECQRCSNWNKFQGQALQERVASNLRLAYSQQLSAATTGCRRDWWPPPSARNCTMSRWPFRAASNKGVAPSFPAWFLASPFSTKKRTALRWLFQTAATSGVHPWKMSLPPSKVP